jgi:hypothetical protein
VKGFLGTWASFVADLNFLVQIAMGIALLAGALLARAKRYAAHGVCQTVVPTLDLPILMSGDRDLLHLVRSVAVAPNVSVHDLEPRYFSFKQSAAHRLSKEEIEALSDCWE